MALRELLIESCSFLSLAFATPALASLELRDCQKIADVGLRAALTRLTMLKSLDVSYSVPLSDDTLREVRAPACQYLRSCGPTLPGGPLVVTACMARMRGKEAWLGQSILQLRSAKSCSCTHPHAMTNHPDVMLRMRLRLYSDHTLVVVRGSVVMRCQRSNKRFLW